MASSSKRCAPRNKTARNVTQADFLAYSAWYEARSGSSSESAQSKKRPHDNPEELASRKSTKTAVAQSASSSLMDQLAEDSNLLDHDNGEPSNLDEDRGFENAQDSSTGELGGTDPANQLSAASASGSDIAERENQAPATRIRESFQPAPVEMSKETDEGTSTIRLHIPGLDTTEKFIEALRSARLDESNMDPEDIARLRSPGPATHSLDMSDIHLVKAIQMFVASTLSSRQTYEDSRNIHLDAYPNDPYPSFEQIKQTIGRITGVNPIRHDMCADSCAGFTGPWSTLDKCPICAERRYHSGSSKPVRQFITIPIGPVIQSFYASPESASAMHYLELRLEEISEYARTHDGKIKDYDDTACGRDLLEAWSNGTFKKNDIALQFSIDGAQLYRSKLSDCWIFIWIIHNLSPKMRYKKVFVIPAGFVPGPNAPKDLDSFIFPSLYHIAALQKEGFSYWDASVNLLIKEAKLLIIIFSADGPAAAAAAGRVGHGGKKGCRATCPLPGRHRSGDGHYYPVMLKPLDYNVDGCSHGDLTLIDLRNFRADIPEKYRNNLNILLGATNQTQYNKRRLETGICKQTLLDGVQTLGVPNIFTMDLMHLSVLNDPELLLGLWRADKQRVKCYAPDNIASWDWAVLKNKKIWKAHGETVARSVQYIPASFGRAPRDPALKLNSGYKAWEFQLYLYGLGPALFRHILPSRYWRHFCKLVAGIRLLQRHSISSDELREGTKYLNQFVTEFELLYYQRKESRIHFVRQSIHLLTHIGPETVRAGPLSCYAQWTMETAIGNLGNEIRQDRDPYANLEQRGLLRARLNALQAQYPQLELPKKNSNQALFRAFGDGYEMLPTAETTKNPLSNDEYLVLMDYWASKGWPNRTEWPNAIARWARLRLPNGQTARSVWYESRATCKLRKASCVEITLNGQMRIADVQFYFYLRFGEELYPLALINLFSTPDQDVLRESSGALYLCNKMEAPEGLRVIPIKSINAVVSMFPELEVTPSGEIRSTGKFSLLRHPFLAMAERQQYGLLDDDDDTELETRIEQNI